MKKKKVGLALGGGGARGFAHVGVLKALNEVNFEVVSIAGISMGSVIGAGFAHNQDLKKLEKYVLDFDYDKFVKPNNHQILMDINKVIHYFDNYLDSCSFEQLQIPLKVLTTDLKDMCGYVIQTGKVSTAITASCTTPYIHKPYKYEGRLLVDGGMISDVPVELVDTEDIDIVIGVNVTSNIEMDDNDNMHLNNFQKQIIAKFPPLSLLWQKKIHNYMRHSKRIVNNELTNLRMSLVKKPLLIIQPKFKNITILSFDKAAEIIDLGYNSTKEVLKQFKLQQSTELKNKKNNTDNYLIFDVA